MADEENKQQSEQGPEFIIQRIYTKDLSFEAPNTPHIFQQDWNPELNLDLQTKSGPLDEDMYEVILTVTVTAKSEKKVAFLIEVQQAGIFTLKKLPEDQIRPMLGSICPSIIYPYAREVVSDVVIRGGFPQLNLAPINFDALYAQHEQEQGETEAEGETEAGGGESGDKQGGGIIH